MIYGIILAAGSGIRMKLKNKKQYLMINNKPVLFYSIDKFLSIKKINKIIVVINEKDINNSVVKLLLKKYRKEINNGKICFVFGGKERYNSVYNALQFINEYIGVKPKDKVLIHDSARPNVYTNDINRLIKCLSNHKAVSLGFKLSDSIKSIIKSSSDLKKVKNSIDRDSHYLISTPQGFNLNMIIKCYDKFIKSSRKLKITDDLQIVEYFSKTNTYILDSNKLNLKITTKYDLNMVKYLL